MIESLVAILSGGATGLLGTALTAGISFFQERQKHRHEVELRRLDAEVARIEGASAAATARIAAASAQETSAWNALTESYRQAATRWSKGDGMALVAVDVVRGLMRPVLTCAFVGLTAWIYWTAAADALEGAAMRGRVIDTVLYLTTTCVCWWFGTRPQRPAGAAR